MRRGTSWRHVDKNTKIGTNTFAMSSRTPTRASLFVGNFTTSRKNQDQARQKRDFRNYRVKTPKRPMTSPKNVTPSSPKMRLYVTITSLLRLF